MGEAVLLLLVLVPSVVLHEVSHGAVALVFGDDTAKQAGRLTLNPVAHVDLFGTVILPALLALTGVGIFGYAKPVPVNPSRMRRPRDHGLLTSLAGPATNILLALLAAFGLRWLADAGGGPVFDSLFAQALVAFGVVNVVLAAFNLIPVPPLDGSAVVERLLPDRWLPAWAQLRQYSMGLLLLLVFVLPGVLGRVFAVAQQWWLTLL